jgi:high-affinity nickel permease
MWNKVKKFAKKVVVVAGAVLALAAPALAVEPATMAEVGATVGTEITANQGMLFGIMGAILGISVLLLIFRRGKGVAR